MTENNGPYFYQLATGFWLAGRNWLNSNYLLLGDVGNRGKLS
jgi:hypothetical protein